MLLHRLTCNDETRTEESAVGETEDYTAMVDRRPQFFAGIGIPAVRAGSASVQASMEWRNRR